MKKAEGNGQSQCYNCNKKGVYNVNWCCFMYQIENDNYTHHYCEKCAKELENKVVE